MCVLAFAWRAHPRWPLLVVGNRDELHMRASAPLARWDAPASVVAGRDLQSGGAWLGVSEEGRFAAVTNRRGFGEPVPDRASRGALVADILTGSGIYADPVSAGLADFNPFSLFTVDRGTARFLTNRPEPSRTLLGPGIYGLSNGALDEPWPKTMQIKGFVLEWIGAGARTPEKLLDEVQTTALPDFGIAPTVPSDVPQEPATSPVFIRNAVYGTRCSTVVAVDDRGEGIIIERRFDAEGRASGETALTFDWPR